MSSIGDGPWWLARVSLADACGGSTGTNVWGALALAREMVAAGESGSIVTLICDGGERYADSYYDAGWLAREGIEIEPVLRALEGLA